MHERRGGRVPRTTHRTVPSVSRKEIGVARAQRAIDRSIHLKMCHHLTQRADCVQLPLQQGDRLWEYVGLPPDMTRSSKNLPKWKTEGGSELLLAEPTTSKLLHQLDQQNFDQ
eukprot:TRINITY_DN45811_c0_g1_i1.p2 TRINITY_DN45811_c0_g1~~TRINITY_DN45811_c0_g1_i1.p2  ORF type:complete len:113 (+),score=9.06 TRINITY_DN45811_c0_g1_i1:628-966(+)